MPVGRMATLSIRWLVCPHFSLLKKESLYNIDLIVGLLFGKLGPLGTSDNIIFVPKKYLIHFFTNVRRPNFSLTQKPLLISHPYQKVFLFIPDLSS